MAVEATKHLSDWDSAADVGDVIVQSWAEEVEGSGSLYMSAAEDATAPDHKTYLSW